MIRVVIADDHQLIREGIRMLGESNPEFSIIGEVDGTEELEVFLEKEIPDVLILDISMGGRRSGLEFLESHKELVEKMPVLILSLYENVSIVRRAIQLGAKGYLPKTETTQCLLTAIQTVSKGSVYLSPRISQALLDGPVTPSPEDNDPESILTNREMVLFSLIAKGLSNKKISQKMKISSSTVSSHIENIKKKMRCVSITELQQAAFEWAREDL